MESAIPTRQATITNEREGFLSVLETIGQLTDEQMLQPGVLGTWSVRGIIAHLAAWNWRIIEEIDAILRDEAGWVSLGGGAL